MSHNDISDNKQELTILWLYGAGFNKAEGIPGMRVAHYECHDEISPCPGAA